MKWLIGAIAGAIFATMSTFALASQPLVDVAWLKENMNDPKVVVLDIRSAVSGSSQETYEKAHIPGAIYSNYATAGWRTKDKNGTPGMLPGADQLSALIGGLGIENDSHVVVVSAGGSGLEIGAATRVYWTFKVAGHDKVSVLNGGMAAWTAERDPKTGKPVNPLESGFVKPIATIFEVRMRPEMIASKEDVQAAMEAGVPLIDNRPADQFLGITKPGPIARSGTIKGAVSVPETWLTKNNGGMIRSKEELARLYKAAGAPMSGKTINFCNTAHWGSLGWFVSHELLGNTDTKLYDGSLIEWSKTDLPMEQRVKLQ